MHPNVLCKESEDKGEGWDMHGLTSVCAFSMPVFFFPPLKMVHLVGTNSHTQHFHCTVESTPEGNIDTPF